MRNLIDKAKAEMALAQKEWRKSDRFGWLPMEVQAYVLFVCAPLEGEDRVFAVGAAATSADFQTFAKPSNLAALADKYKATGFVIKRMPKLTAEWTYVPAKAKGGSRG